MKRLSIAALALSAMSAGLVLVGPVAGASTFTVNSVDYSNDGSCTPGAFPAPPAADCTLWEAIVAANANPGADTIWLPNGQVLAIPTGMTGSTSGIDQAFPTIVGTLTLELNNATLDANMNANQAVLVFQVPSGSALSVGSGTIRDFAMVVNNSGITSLIRMRLLGNGNTGWFGTTISSSAGQLSLDGSTLTGNVNAIVSNAPLLISNSTLSAGTGVTISHNSDAPFTIRGSKILGNANGVYNAIPAPTCASQGQILDTVIDSNQSYGAWLECPTLIQGSTISNNVVSDMGAGIRVCDNLANQSNTVTVRSSRVTGNRSIGAGYGGGGIHVDSGCSLVVEKSTIANNRADGFGGGISIEGFGSGVAPWNSPIVTIEQSSIANNSAANGGGISIVGPRNTATALSIRRSTLLQNVSTGQGGALSVVPLPGVINGTAGIALRNVTFWQNSAANGGFIGSTTPARISATNTFVARDTAGVGSECSMAAGSTIYNSGYNVFENFTANGCPVSLPGGWPGLLAALTTINTTSTTNYAMTVVPGTQAGRIYVQPSAGTPGVNLGFNVSGETEDQYLALTGATIPRDIGAIELH